MRRKRKWYPENIEIAAFIVPSLHRADEFELPHNAIAHWAGHEVKGSFTSRRRPAAGRPTARPLTAAVAAISTGAFAPPTPCVYRCRSPITLLPMQSEQGKTGATVQSVRLEYGTQRPWSARRILLYAGIALLLAAAATVAVLGTGRNGSGFVGSGMWRRSSRRGVRYSTAKIRHRSRS